jgi:hypothetical protein
VYPHWNNPPFFPLGDAWCRDADNLLRVPGGHEWMVQRPPLQDFRPLLRVLMEAGTVRAALSGFQGVSFLRHRRIYNEANSPGTGSEPFVMSTTRLR